MKEITVNGIKYVEASRQLAEHVEGMQYCIIRCDRAGVHAGYVKEREGQEVTLVKTRRLWKWYGKTLTGLAKDGSFAPDKCKYSDEGPEITLLDAIEVIPCTEAGKQSVIDVAPWKNE